MDYTKLGNLVDSTFVFKSILGAKFKKWDNENKKMLVRDTWEGGYQLKIEVETDRGKLDLSEGQLGMILKAFFDRDTLTSNIKMGIVEVKSNGKTGMDIRYYFNKAGYEIGNVEKPIQQEMPRRDDDDGVPEISEDDLPNF